MILYILFTLYVVVSGWYIHKLHMRIRAHEQAWTQITQLTDQNRDGDVVIHAKHL